MKKMFAALLICSSTTAFASGTGDTGSAIQSMKPLTLIKESIVFCDVMHDRIVKFTQVNAQKIDITINNSSRTRFEVSDSEKLRREGVDVTLFTALIPADRMKAKIQISEYQGQKQLFITMMGEKQFFGATADCNGVDVDGQQAEQYR